MVNFGFDFVLFCMKLFCYKLSNLILSVSFCFLSSGCVWGCLKYKNQFIYGQKLNVMEFYWTLWNISKYKYLQAKVKTLLYNKNIQITKQLLIYRMINKNDRQSWSSLLSSYTVASNYVPSFLHKTNLHKSVHINLFLMHLHLISSRLVLQTHTFNTINSKETRNSPHCTENEVFHSGFVQ